MTRTFTLADYAQVVQFYSAPLACFVDDLDTRGHLMEFVRPSLDPRVLPAAAVEDVGEGEEVLVAGWPIARQHPKGKDGTVFVTVEDETGDVQVILWPRVFHRSRRDLGSQVLLIRGVVSRWDGTVSVVVSEVKGVHPRVPMPAAHDWR